MNQNTFGLGLPDQLSQAISSQGGGRVVLVLGAGCSKEDPTGLPLGGELSEDCLRQLIRDGVLSEGEVTDERDLSALAEAVFQKTGSQRELTERFPQNAFRCPEPNEGYLIMAALLLEGAVSDTMTLNFDFAARKALTALGAKEAVSTISGPQDFANLGTRNLIYLHRDIDSPPDDIVLRSTQIDQGWWGSWQQVIAQRVLASPCVVFVGLGSPASVLLETTKRIVESVGRPRVTVYVVDPSAHDDSLFASTLQVGSKEYFRMGWSGFMRELTQPVIKEHLVAIAGSCDELTQEMQVEAEDVADICQRLMQLGLVGLGRLRSAWMLENTPYTAYQQGLSLRLFSSLILGVRLLERLIAREARFGKDGLVDFFRDGYATRVMVCSGGGTRTRPMVEAEIEKRYRSMRVQGKAPSFALIAGVEHGPEGSTPRNIAVETDPDDLVAGVGDFHFLYVSEIRSDPATALRVIL